MSRSTSTDIEKDKLARFKSIKKTIQTLEKRQKQVLKQGKLALSGAWVARSRGDKQSKSLARQGLGELKNQIKSTN